VSEPNMRRIIRAQRITQELGFSDLHAALEAAVQWQRALKVIHTWAGFPDSIDAKQVRDLCKKALEGTT
jgi:hypothetical protein